MSDYYCPNCGSDLETQYGFSKYDEYYQCEECGNWIVNPDHDSSCERFPDVIWICDSCEKLLNTQCGFSDWLDMWICKECGYCNIISASEIDDYEDDNFSNDSDDDYSLLGAAAILLGGLGIAKLVKKGIEKRKSEQNEKNSCISEENPNNCEYIHENSDNTYDNKSQYGTNNSNHSAKCYNCGSYLNLNNVKNYCPQCGNRVCVCRNCHSVLNPFKVKNYCPECGCKL